MKLLEIEITIKQTKVAFVPENETGDKNARLECIFGISISKLNLKCVMKLNC